MFCHHTPTCVLCFHELQVRTRSFVPVFLNLDGRHAIWMLFLFYLLFIIKIILQWHFSTTESQSILSKRVVKNSKDGYSTTSLSNLFQGLTTFTVEVFSSLYSYIPIFIFSPYFVCTCLHLFSPALLLYSSAKSLPLSSQ